MRWVAMNVYRLRMLLVLLVAAAFAVGLFALAATKPAEAAFPGTNGLIVFASTRSIDANDPSAVDYDIFTMDPDDPDNTLTQLTVNDAHDADPVWSPDGTKIAFTTARDGFPDFPSLEIYTMDANGSNPTNITNFSSAHDSDPAWSPDGTKIAFVSNRSTRKTRDVSIFTMDANGSNPRKHTKPKDYDDGDHNPAWSPDGTKIAFKRFHFENNTLINNRDIYVLKAKRPEGRRNRAVNLTKHPAQDGELAWSPDGTEIAFSSTRDSSTLVNNEVYVMTSEGQNPTRLTTTAAGLFDDQPAFSPDKNKIAFTSNRDGNNEIYMMDANGNNQTNLTNNSADDHSPDWQPVVN